MSLKDQIAARSAQRFSALCAVQEMERAWNEFHRWEAVQPCAEREPGRVIADLGAILDWLPRESRLEDPDPEKTGVRKMFEALRHVSGLR